MDFIEPCFGIGHNLSLICQMTSEDIKHQLISYTDTSKYNIIRPSYIGYKAQSYIDSGAGWHLHMHTRPKYRQKRVCTGTRARTHSPTHPHTHPSIHTQTRTHAPPPPPASIHPHPHPSIHSHARTYTHTLTHCSCSLPQINECSYSLLLLQIDPLLG